MGDGTADTKINWKGKGYLCGHHMKVRVQGSEKGTEIPAGAPVMVVGMEGLSRWWRRYKERDVRSWIVSVYEERR